MVTTPTPTERFTSDPVQSPYPSSGNGESDRTLTSRQFEEVRNVFNVFDVESSGFIDVPTMEILARSLGFRMGQQEIRDAIQSMQEERQTDDVGSIDLEAVCYILHKRGYSSRNAEEEMQSYFRLFDRGNTGYVTLEDLQQLQREVIDAEQRLNIGTSVNVEVDDVMLKAMINEFDTNADSVLDFDEFKVLLAPIIS
ncbi:hypothetical protein THAOC_17417 [Thalassiosira oceanica]|uniref:Calmodulin n=1 Tax=Thalassiosira oceanica TaxID=159749 RepID=K0S9N2_THAOC|nr:hypothetical protein THAOC_17417 [Thalassiosira oceanica]|eukprot:EJK61995.1 hypothetical protein THAOC_17417 [Thalassiosira oceanica]